MRALLPLLLAGCVGEASVSYQGAVGEGNFDAHEFATSRDVPSPLLDARVELLLNDIVQTSKTTDELGHYDLLETVFGGFAGDDTEIAVRVTAIDGRSYTYSTIYEDTTDPTVSDRSCDPACPVEYLNFSLAALDSP